MTMEEIKALKLGDVLELIRDRIEADGLEDSPENRAAYFEAYKNELLAERREVLQQRVDAIKDLRLAMVKAGLNQPNSALLVKDILESDDEARLIQLEAGDLESQAEQAALEQIKQDKKQKRLQIKQKLKGGALKPQELSDMILEIYEAVFKD